jgi:hypothetical protein
VSENSEQVGFSNNGNYRSDLTRSGAYLSDMGEPFGTGGTTPEEPTTNVPTLTDAGVDPLRRDDTWYVLEVNAAAGVKRVFEATGVHNRARRLCFRVQTLDQFAGDGQLRRARRCERWQRVTLDCRPASSLSGAVQR